MIHPTAIIEPGAQLGDGCEIHAYAIIRKGAILGDRVSVHPFAVVGGEFGTDRGPRAGMSIANRSRGGAAEPRAARRADGAVPMTSSVTILLIDDEPLLRRATALILARHGARVTAVGTADEAVSLTRKHLYDVAVLDVSPPGPSATEVLDRIRLDGLVPRRVIAVSSRPLEGREAEGLTEVLPRPYPFESLLRAVFGVGGRPRTRSGVFACADSPDLKASGPHAAGRGGRGPGG